MFLPKFCILFCIIIIFLSHFFDCKNDKYSSIFISRYINISNWQAVHLYVQNAFLACWGNAQAPQTMKINFHRTTFFDFCSVYIFKAFHNFLSPFRCVVWIYFLKISEPILYIQDVGNYLNLRIFPIFWMEHEIDFTISRSQNMVIYLYCICKKDIPLPVKSTVPECPFSILHYIFNTWCCLSTICMIPKCLNACIIASSFSGVHCGCLALSDLDKLKFSPTSSPPSLFCCRPFSVPLRSALSKGPPDL